MDESMTFTVIDESGEERECEVLFTFENPETHTNYIVYTDYTLDENGGTRVFASIFDPESDSPTLMPLETEAEWQMVEQLLNDLQESMDEDS